MPRKKEIENPVRLSGWVPEMTKVTLVAIKNRLDSPSVGKTITRLAVKEGNRLRITEEELREAKEEIDRG